MYSTKFVYDEPRTLLGYQQQRFQNHRPVLGQLVADSSPRAQLENHTVG